VMVLPLVVLLLAASLAAAGGMACCLVGLLGPMDLDGLDGWSGGAGVPVVWIGEGTGSQSESVGNA